MSNCYQNVILYTFAFANLCILFICVTIEAYERSFMSDTPTFCYTYNVSMVIQVLSDSEESAKKQLDDKGGYVSDRQVTLIDALPLYSGEESE